MGVGVGVRVGVGLGMGLGLGVGRRYRRRRRCRHRRRRWRRRSFTRRLEPLQIGLLGFRLWAKVLHESLIGLAERGLSVSSSPGSGLSFNVSFRFDRNCA